MNDHKAIFLTDQLKDFPFACDYFLILSSSVGGALFLALSLEICKRATDSHVSSYSHVVIVMYTLCILMGKMKL